MSVGIIYLLTNTQLAARLVVSIYSLRQWYDGPITLFTTRDQSFEIGELIANDPRLDVDHQQIEERPGEGYQSSYLTKTKILSRSPYRHTVFLDADTLVAGDLTQLFDAAQSTRLTATGFVGWSTQHELMLERLEKWRVLQNTPADSYDLEKRIDTLQANPFTAVNAGVFAYENDPSLVSRWDDLAWLAKDLPHPDEISLQLMLFEEDHQILGQQFNCHPWSYNDGVGVRIWHFAGLTHLVKDCVDIWVPVYEECQEHNLARIQTWWRIEPTEEGLAAQSKSNSKTPETMEAQ